MSKPAGNPVSIGGRQLFLPPITVGILRRHRAAYDLLIQTFKAYSKGEPVEPTVELVTAIAELFHACLVRAEPDVTLEWVEDSIALGDLGQRINEILAPAPGALAPKGGQLGEATSP